MSILVLPSSTLIVPKQRWVRTLLVFAFSPALLALVAMVTVMRPLTAYEDRFHGPEKMWKDLWRWARTGDLRFPSWQRACRGHIGRHNASPKSS